MSQHGQGNGTLVPTGKHEPERTVSFDIEHEVAQKQGANGEPVEWNRATVRSLQSHDGTDIPDGDFDLVDGSGEMTRLKHVPEDPEWLVTSSLP